MGQIHAFSSNSKNIWPESFVQILQVHLLVSYGPSEEEKHLKLTLFKCKSSEKGADIKTNPVIKALLLNLLSCSKNIWPELFNL